MFINDEFKNLSETIRCTSIIIQRKVFWYNLKPHDTNNTSGMWEPGVGLYSSDSGFRILLGVEYCVNKNSFFFYCIKNSIRELSGKNNSYFSVSFLIMLWIFSDGF
jgi:hypothetical protein